MLWSIDSRQKRLSADQYHKTVSRAQVSTYQGLKSRERVFLGHFSLTSYKLLVNLRLSFNIFFQQQLFLVFWAPPSNVIWYTSKFTL